MATWREIENQKMKDYSPPKTKNPSGSSGGKNTAPSVSTSGKSTVPSTSAGKNTAPTSSAPGKNSAGSSSSRTASGGSSGSSGSGSSSSARAAAQKAQAEANLRALQAQREARMAQVEREAYASLMREKYNMGGSSGIEKNPNTGLMPGAGRPSRNSDPMGNPIPVPMAGANVVGMASANPSKVYDRYQSLNKDDTGGGYVKVNQGPVSTITPTPGVYSSDNLPQFGEEGYFFEGVRPDDSILGAQDSATAAAVQAYMNQLPLVNESYDNLARQAYAEYMKARTGLPEQVSGMATGMADSLLTQNDLNYQNNLSSNELARAAALADVRTQAAQAQAQGELQAAQIQAELEQQAYQRRLEVMRMAQQQQAAARSGSGSLGSGSYEPDLTAPQAWSAYENNLRTDKVLSALSYWYGPNWAEALGKNTASTNSRYDPVNDTKTALIDSWYRSNTESDFASMIRRALENGTISLADYNNWANS